MSVITTIAVQGHYNHSQEYHEHWITILLAHTVAQALVWEAGSGNIWESALTTLQCQATISVNRNQCYGSFPGESKCSRYYAYIVFQQHNLCVPPLCECFPLGHKWGNEPHRLIVSIPDVCWPPLPIESHTYKHAVMVLMPNTTKVSYTLKHLASHQLQPKTT